jgi:hypothetical protein
MGLIISPTLLSQADEVIRGAARSGVPLRSRRGESGANRLMQALAYMLPLFLEGQPSQAQIIQITPQGTHERQLSDAYGLDPAYPCRLA